MSNAAVLIPEAILRAKEPELRSRIGGVRSEYVADAEDEVYGVAFRYFLLFKLWPDLLGWVTPELTAAVRFYNKYYWFLRLKHLWTQKYGYDAGVEQQAFQLLETADCDVDWSVVEEIEKQVNAEVGDPDGSERNT